MKKDDMRCRGARDFLPGDMQRFRTIESTFINTCKNWGYEEVRTPTLEYLHLFTSAGTLTSKMLNNVYSFLDWDGWSGERVVLRPDGTIPVVRLFMENLQARTIARLFYVTNVFSFESTGKENRERWQCGVEYLGNAGTEAEIELIMLARDALERTCVGDIKLSVSHSGLLKALLDTLELEMDDYSSLINSIKAVKWGQLGKTKGERDNGIELVNMLLTVKGKSSGYLDNIKSVAGSFSSKVESAINDFSVATGALDALKCEYEIDITTTNNFEYYTGLCFKFFNSENQTICSGGRYNDLLPLMGGRDIPACGFAIYMDPILDTLAMEQAGGQGTSIVVRCPLSSPVMITNGYRLVSMLHSNGFNTTIDFEGKPDSCRYSVEPSNKISQRYLLKDLERNKVYECMTARKIIDILRAEG